MSIYNKEQNQDKKRDQSKPAQPENKAKAAQAQAKPVTEHNKK